jgi:hypothetical protein
VHQLPLVSISEPPENPTEAALRALEIERLTPLEALEWLARAQRRLKGEAS